MPHAAQKEFLHQALLSDAPLVVDHLPSYASWLGDFGPRTVISAALDDLQPPEGDQKSCPSMTVDLAAPSTLAPEDDGKRANGDGGDGGDGCDSDFDVDSCGDIDDEDDTEIDAPSRAHAPPSLPATASR
jgi:hypothetical protein